jgi:hypothetical protein
MIEEEDIEVVEVAEVVIELHLHLKAPILGCGR